MTWCPFFFTYSWTELFSCLPCEAIGGHLDQESLSCCPHNSTLLKIAIENAIEHCYWKMIQKCILSSCGLVCRLLKHEWDKNTSRHTAEKEQTWNLNSVAWTRHKGALLIDYSSIDSPRAVTIQLTKMFYTFFFVKKCYVFNVQSIQKIGIAFYSLPL